MDRKAIAIELVRVAKELTADSGDVPVYLNISDFIVSKSGKPMTREQAMAAENVLNPIILSEFDNIKKLVATSLKTSPLRKRLAGFDLVLKKS